MLEQLEIEIENLGKEDKELDLLIFNYDRQLALLGLSKRRKTGEVRAAIDREIEELRIEKQNVKNRMKEIEKTLIKLHNQLEKAQRVRELDLAQLNRDLRANKQFNGCGKSPNRGRDVSWPV